MRKITSNNKEWFCKWFGSPYYHILYKHHDVSEAKIFIDNLANQLKLTEGSRILDVGCGTGRHSFYMNEKGFEVTGIDIVEENIMKAASPHPISGRRGGGKTSPPNPLSGRRGGIKTPPAFFVHDMREVFRENYFDVVLNLFTSFGYFESEEDDVRVLKSVYSDLKKKGVFVLDFMNVKKVIANLKNEEKKSIDHIEFGISRFFKNGFIVKRIKVKDLTPQPPLQGESGRKNLTPGLRLVPSPKREREVSSAMPNTEPPWFEERVKAITLDDFKKYFAKTGFQIMNLFGDYDWSNFDEKRSERLIIVANKKL